MLLRGHAGDSYRVDRKGREPEHIESLTLTFILTVQPSVLRQIGETPVEKSRGELERFMYAVPSSFVGYRKINPAPVPQAVDTAYETKVSALACRYADRDATATLEFDSEATDRFTHVQQRVEASLRRDGMLGSPRLKGWGSKLAGAVARLAGILHIASGESDTAPITAESVDAAAKIGDYYAAHAVAAFDLMDRAAPNAKAEELLLFIRRNGLTEFSARDILTQTSRSRFADAEAVDSALEVLTEYGWIFPQEVVRKPGPGRPPSPRFTVHPRAFQNDETAAQSAQSAETPTEDHSADTADIAATSAVSNLTPSGLRADRSKRANRSDDTNSLNTQNGSNRVPLREDPSCDVCGKPIPARHVAAYSEAIHPTCKQRQTA